MLRNFFNDYFYENGWQHHLLGWSLCFLCLFCGWNRLEFSWLPLITDLNNSAIDFYFYPRNWYDPALTLIYLTGLVFGLMFLIEMAENIFLKVQPSANDVISGLLGVPTAFALFFFFADSYVLLGLALLEIGYFLYNIVKVIQYLRKIRTL